MKGINGMPFKTDYQSILQTITSTDFFFQKLLTIFNALLDNKTASEIGPKKNPCPTHLGWAGEFTDSV